jgi:hypothetical protein
METLRYETIDGYDVVTGVSERIVNPVGTQEKVRAALEKSPEKSEYEGVLGQMGDLRRNTKTLLSQLPEKPEYKESIERNEQAYNRLDADRSQKYQALTARCAALRKEHTQYFGLRRGEVQPENTPELAAAFRSLGKRQKLTVGGEKLEDNRGRRYLTRDHTVETVQKLGEALPDGATWLEDTTQVQRDRAQEVAEQRRVTALSAEARMVEMQTELATAGMRAMQQRSINEIQGQSADEALKNSQSLYRMLEQEIRGRYEN